MTAAPKVYSYLRFSTPEQAMGDSKRRQVEAARNWAAERGLTLDDELADEGVSGFRGANTRDDAALGSFLAAVQAGDVPKGSILIVESLDRLSRDHILEAQTIINSLLIAGITIVTLGDRREYSRDIVNAQPLELVVSMLTLMRANEESETKAKRLRAAWEAKRRAAVETGKRMTTTCPAWLEASKDGSGFDVIPDRAAVVRRIFADTLAGKGQHQIAADLTAEGVPTWRGGVGWHRTYVRKIVDNPAVVGDLLPHVTERQSGGGRLRRRVGDPVPGYYPAVIDIETWNRARALVGQRGTTGTSGRGRHAGEPIRHLLAGIATCPACDGTMTRVSKGPGGGRAYLVCAKAKRKSGCRYVSVPVEEVETSLIHWRADLLDNAPAVREGEAQLREQIAGLEREANAVETELTDIAAIRPRLQVHRDQSAHLYADLERLRQERQVALEALKGVGSKLVDARVARLWEALDVTESQTDELPDRTAVNAAMRGCFVAVVIDYEERELVFRWRHGGESRMAYGNPFRD